MDRRTFLTTVAVAPLAALPTLANGENLKIDYRLEGGGLVYLQASNSTIESFAEDTRLHPKSHVVWIRPARYPS